MFADQAWEGRCFVGCRFTNCDVTRTDLGASQHRATAFHTWTFQRTVLAESRRVVAELMDADDAVTIGARGRMIRRRRGLSLDVEED